MSGVVIAQTSSRAELDQILSKDVFYPDKASYDINEIVPHLITENIKDYQE